MSEIYIKDIRTRRGKRMADKLKNIYLKLKASYLGKRLKKQKAHAQVLMMSGYIKRVK